MRRLDRARRPQTGLAEVKERGEEVGHDGNYVLTARHLVTTGGGITGSLRPASELQFRLDGLNYSAVAVYAEFGADVALVKLSAPCLTYVELYTGASGSESSQVFTAIGFGQNDSDGDGRWGPDGLGVRRHSRIGWTRSSTLAFKGRYCDTISTRPPAIRLALPKGLMAMEFRVAGCSCGIVANGNWPAS